MKLEREFPHSKEGKHSYPTSRNPSPELYNGPHTCIWNEEYDSPSQYPNHICHTVTYEMVKLAQQDPKADMTAEILMLVPMFMVSACHWRQSNYAL